MPSAVASQHIVHRDEHLLSRHCEYEMEFESGKREGANMTRGVNECLLPLRQPRCAIAADRWGILANGWQLKVRPFFVSCWSHASVAAFQRQACFDFCRRGRTSRHFVSRVSHKHPQDHLTDSESAEALRLRHAASTRLEKFGHLAFRGYPPGRVSKR